MSLIRTAEELRKYIPATVTVDLDLLLPYITNQAENQRLKKNILGPELYATLVNDYENDDIDLETPQGEFLIKVQHWIAHYALYRSIPTGIVNISASGINQTISESIKPLTPQQIDLLMDDYLRSSDEALEDLLSFLEENSDDYEDWKNSPSYTLIKESFIASAQEFDAEYSICASRSTFLSLKPFMLEVQSSVIKDTLTTDLYDAMLESVEANDFSDPEKVILPWIRKAIAYLTINKSIPHVAVRITDEGIQVYSRPDRTNTKARIAANEKRLADLRQACKTEGEIYLSKIVDYIKSHLEDFSEYPQDIEPVNNNGRFKMSGSGNTVGF